MKKTGAIFSCIVYIFTAQLGVHAFAMHAHEGMHEISIQHEQHSHTEDEKCGCDEHSSHGNHRVCIDQGKEVTEQEKIVQRHISYSICYFIEKITLLPEILSPGYRGLDPGGGEKDTFLDIHYGHGIVMHC